MRRHSVLIVDDQNNWRDLFAQILRDQFGISTAHDYDSAVKAIDKVHPHVVVTDLRLNDGQSGNEDGLRLLEYVNQNRHDLAVILVTGYATVPTARKALAELGAFDYIEKYPPDGPRKFDFRLFRDTVQKAAQEIELLRVLSTEKNFARFVFARVQLSDGVESPLVNEMDFVAQRPYTIKLGLHSTFRNGAQQILLSPPTHGNKIQLGLFIFGKHLRVEPGSEVLWQIPLSAVDGAEFEFVITPPYEGPQQLIVELKQGHVFLARMNWQINVRNV